MDRIRSFILAAVLTIFVGIPHAVGQRQQDTEGTIKSVDTKTMTFILIADEEDITLRVNDATSYALEGEPADMTKALQVGNYAVVIYSDSTALSVESYVPQFEDDIEIDDEKLRWQ